MQHARWEIGMRRDALVIWTAVILLSVIDLLLCYRLQMRFYDWSRLALAGAVTAGIALFYHISGRSTALARAAHWTLLWLIFVNAGTVLTYIAGACGGHLYDAPLAAIDAAFGFDWDRWYNFLVPHRNLRFVLWLAYLSLFPQILISIFWFSFHNLDYFNYELLLNNILSLLIASMLFVTFPAFGHLAPGRGLEVEALRALRGGGPLSFGLSQLQGLISFPSYHTVLAVLLTYAHRRSSLLPAIALVNAIMLFSIPSYGGHYLTDIIAGAAVALLAIAVNKASQRPHAIGPAAAI
jgi:PAP2 superfamily